MDNTSEYGNGIRDLENITFKNMTVINTSEYGNGISMSNAKVELVDVAVKGCKRYALYMKTSTSESTLVATRCEFADSARGAGVHGTISSLTSATFNNCVFHDNENDGIQVADHATMHFHGEATAIHSNGGCGIFAVALAKVHIHLPSHHNTFYNNGGEDRNVSVGATITNV